MLQQQTALDRLNSELQGDWQARLTTGGRIYYVHHRTQTSSWLPPRENWQDQAGLPYGWEEGRDGSQKQYFINHVDKYTTREDPRQDSDYVEPPRPREVELLRDQVKGFGFVAGSEKPVVVRFVTDGGPSVDKLLPGDQILKINGEEVRRAPREKVIQLVRSCRHSILLTVCQPYFDNSSRKSAILTAAKKARLRNNPSRVRFADAILVNGTSVASQQSPQESGIPFLPNVLKVFLENGQTKSFKYDNKTTVKDVMQSLGEKLNISSIHHFSLVLQNMRSSVPRKLTLLQDHETLAEIAARPAARHFRCQLRVAFVPQDAHELLQEDPVAFEYFYMQCCNDVTSERFASEMKYDTALRLAALQIQQHASSNKMPAKISIKAIEKEFGLEKFVAHSLLENMKSKDLRKMLTQYVKLNQSLAGPGQKQLSSLQAKLHYLKIVSELKTFGSRVFMVTLLDQKAEAMVLVGPKAGISVVTNIKNYTLSQLADFHQVSHLKVSQEKDTMHRVDVTVSVLDHLETLGFGLLMEDAQNFVAMIVGYYRIFVDRDKNILEKAVGKSTSDPSVPGYRSEHLVLASPWAYPEDVSPDPAVLESRPERIIDLSQDPPLCPSDQSSASSSTRGPPGQSWSTDIDDLHPSVPEFLSSRHSSERIFEEEVTSFSRRASEDNGDNPNTMMKFLPGGTFRTEVTAPESSSHFWSSYHSPPSSSCNGSSAPSFNGLSTSSVSQPPSMTTFKADLPKSSSSHHIVSSSTSATSMSRIPSISEHNRMTQSDLGRYPSDTTCLNILSVEPDQNDASFSDHTSSSSSISAPEVTERQVLLGDKGEEPTGLLSAFRSSSARWNGGLEAESDDTDSADTPHCSPARQRVKIPRTDIGLHSFGLHSPDSMPPTSDPAQGTLHHHVQLTDNGTAETLNGVSSHEETVSQRLYLDPDIIDLTNFPLPPEITEGNLMQDLPDSFLAPDLKSRGSSRNIQPTDQVTTLPPRSSHTASRLERSASIGNCPDFFDADIDALIAQFTIPPPPPPSSVEAQSKPQTLHIGTDLAPGVPQTDHVFNDLSDLIIPPPPACITGTLAVEDIAVVIPVPLSSALPEKTAQTARKKDMQHKRSTSLDISLLRKSIDQLQSKTRSVSMDDKPKTINSLLSQASEVVPARSSEVATEESPALVSQMLHSLLLSLPAPSQEPSQSQPRTPKQFQHSSLRVRSSHGNMFLKKASEVNNVHDSNSIPVFNLNPSLRLKLGPRSQSYESMPSSVMSFGELETELKLTGTAAQFSSDKHLEKSFHATETFASVKARLKEYRDALLTRSKANSSRDHILPGAGTREASYSTKGSLRRSESFSKLMSQSESFSKLMSQSESFSKLMSQSSRKLSSEDLTSLSWTSSDSNWKLKNAKSALPTHLPKESFGESVDEKRVPVVRDALFLNPSTLRPISNSTSQQTRAAKSGPIKALPPVPIRSDELKTPTSGQPDDSGVQTIHSSLPAWSKDDNLLTNAGLPKDKNWTHPFATIKMPRPSSTVSHQRRADSQDTHQYFNNFDALRNTPDVRADFREADTSEILAYPHRHRSQSREQQLASPGSSVDISFHNSLTKNNPETCLNTGTDLALFNFLNRCSPGGSIDSSAATTLNQTSYDHESGMVNGSKMVVSPSSTTGSLSLTPPPPQPNSPPVSCQDPSLQQSSVLHVLSHGVTHTVKSVLAHNYSDIESVGDDIDNLLAELRLTMISLHSSRLDKKSGQLRMCLSEFQSQARQFGQAARMIANSTSQHGGLLGQVEPAVHRLALTLLHGQATMLLMSSPDSGLHLGFQLIQAANSFKSTIMAAYAAAGKSSSDPSTQYLIRQSHHLVAMLVALENAINEVHS